MSDHNVDVITAYQSDLNRTVEHRRKLLEQLYATTLSFLELKAPGFHHNDLTGFLDANDISKGKSFDLSTLPGADVLGFQRGSKPDVSRTETLSQDAVAVPESLRPVLNQTEPKDASSSSTAGPTSVKSNDISSKLGAGRGVNQELPRAATPIGRYSGGPSGDASESSKGEAGQNLTDLSKSLPPSNQLQTQTSGAVKREPEIHQVKSAEDVSSRIERRQAGIDHEESGNGAVLRPNGKGKSDGAEQLQLGRGIHNLPIVTPQSKAESPSDLAQSNLQRTPKDANDLPSQFLRNSLGPDQSMADVEGLSTEGNVGRQEFSQGSGRDAPDSAKDLSRGLRDYPIGMNREASKDLTFSRRPPMRIDTKVPLPQDPSSMTPVQKTASTPAGAPSTATATATPSRQSHQPTTAQSPPERMTTRFSSGTLRHKSVSELMGETPKITPSQADKANAEAAQDESAIAQTPKSATSFVSPDPAAFRLRLNEIKERDKNNKPSTVVFARQQHTQISRQSETSQAQQNSVKETPIKDRDYLFTLLVSQLFMQNQGNRQDRRPLTAVLKSAPKTLSTSDWYTDFTERQDTQILRKVHHLQDQHKWSLRQPERSVEPDRPASHWDVLLGQMKWMRTDFREEGKWKTAAARHLASACAQWVRSPAEERRNLQVKVKLPPSLPRSRSNSESQTVATPDLVHSMDDDVSEGIEDDLPSISAGEPPAAIFSLPPDMFVFGLNKSPVSEKILHELPLYQPSVTVQEGALHVKDFLPDASWKLPLVPISKYTEGKIVRREEEPPRKRSRHYYADEDDGPEYPEKALSPNNEEVALFNPEYKHIRDRIHTGHAFRPPSEHIMPSQSFFESRQPSQWTLAEDDELRKLVREYAYNWSLISSCLASPSTFSSGAERRTPWECFERWVTLEGLPTEMSKINYFRAYHSRLQAAARTYEAQQQALIQQNPNNAAHLSRRRSTQPFTVDRRKNNKYIHLIDAMRKQAKKRETKMLKDQHTASTAALRKANEPQKPRQQMPTPQEFGKIKHQQQVKREEQLKAAKIHYLHQQKQIAQNRANQQSSSQLNGQSAARSLNQGAPTDSAPVPASSAMSQFRGSIGDPNRSGSQAQRLMNGQANGLLANSPQGAPHAPMQPQMQVQMGQRVPPQIGTENIRIYQEATRVQAEQQAQLQRQRQQQHPQFNGHISPPNTQNLNNLSQANANMLASLDGRSSPATNGAQQVPGSSSPPRSGQAQALSSGVTPAVNQISTQIKLRNPQASAEQVQRATTEQLYRMSQAAMHAATGNSNTGAMNGLSGLAGMPNGGPAILNHQQYAHMMREQQRSQQRGNNTGAGNVNGSRSATPLNQRPGSAQSGRGPSQSPRAGQVGIAGGQ